MSELICDYCDRRVAVPDQTAKDELEKFLLNELGVRRITGISVDCGRCGWSHSEPHISVGFHLPETRTNRPFKVGDEVLHHRFCKAGRVEQIGLAPLVTVRFQHLRNPITLNEKDLVPRKMFSAGGGGKK